MSTSDHDVLKAMERAAMDPPRMSLAAGSVLSGGKGRLRRRRTAGAGMTLAAAALAVTAWVGLDPTSDTALQDIAPADKTAVDQDTSADWTTDLDAPLATPGLPGFTDVSIERAPGDDHFTVRVPDGDGWVELERVEADLPAGVELFHNAGYSLVLSPAVHPGAPTLYLQPKLDGQWQQTTAGKGEAQVHAWWVNRTTRPEDIADVYWVFEDGMLASSGTEIIDADVELDGVQARVSIVPELDVWADRADPAGVTMSPIGTVKQPEPGADVPESVVAVLAGSVNDVQASGIGGTVDGPVPVAFDMASQDVGDYSVAAVSLPGVDLPALDYSFTVDVMTWTDAEGKARTEFVGPMQAAGEALPDGTVRVSFTAIDDEMVFDPQNDDVVATPARDGGWVVVATPPDGSANADHPLLFLRSPQGEWPAGPAHQQSGTVEGAEELVWFTVATNDSYSRTGADQRVRGNDDLEVDVLFDSVSNGPWWARGDEPPLVSLADTRWKWSIQEDLGLWAARCTGADEGVWGELSSVDFAIEQCGSTAFPESQAYLISVLPSDVAHRATPVLRDEPGVTPEPIEWDEPEIADLGNGRSLFIARQTVWPTTEAGSGLIGLDVDGDGIADDDLP